jgi:hypothetical protein
MTPNDLQKLAAEQDAKLRTVLTDAEIRANAKLIDQILARIAK